MGKLAVPEYILNKPGKLTPAEFEKMKLHASVGADILSAIEFPYPVVPIVRHHHENWDGSGYPAGLKGTDIPIGARILSVVDCFDALTSDRPYRPKLSDEDAIAILLQRRASMYDPLIVDTFIRVHGELAPTSAIGASAAVSVLQEITIAASAIRGNNQQIAGFENISAGSDETFTMLDIAQVVTEHNSLEAAAEPIASRLRRATPFALAVFFRYEDATDEIVAMEAVGEGAPLVRGLRIPLGQRLSGWVAANRQTISNSDAVLDLGEIAKVTRPRLRVCLSTPLVANDQLAGVFTLYSSAPDVFTDDHRRLVEAAARYIAPVVRQANRPKRHAEADKDPEPPRPPDETGPRGPRVH